MKEEQELTHPSFGMIGISRISGNVRLFGSDVTHMHFIGVTVKEAKVKRSLHRDWYHGGDLVSQVWMSEAQFAQMITSPNVSDGVPCTIRYMQGDHQRTDIQMTRGSRPMPPEATKLIEQYHVEAEEKRTAIKQQVEEVAKAVNAFISNDAKPNKENLRALLSKVTILGHEVGSNLDFLIKSLQEDLEKKVQSAVTEFEAHVSASLAQRGLEHLQATAPRLTIGGDYREHSQPDEEFPLRVDPSTDTAPSE